MQKQFPFSGRPSTADTTTTLQTTPIHTSKYIDSIKILHIHDYADYPLNHGAAVWSGSLPPSLDLPWSIRLSEHVWRPHE
ncbi:uncharacterized protein B0T23DRAFT_404419 [Neurospora hispaniola]|uniref:Uncharacterized protein n=1 Tax=Neurospora hispaniola TaxID=588809 RepID=A0AAJ0I7M6_9PEZI|nr:hypothetical protein B0T23DRAFT_404419 [Neurospora hispaniola]